MSDRIIFLGAGGGGYMLVEQVLATGGIYLELDGAKILIDPGSGSLVRSKENGLDLKKLDAVLLSHRHPDHAGDINTVLEAMCGDEGGEGVLLVERNCLEGETRVIDDYHEALPRRAVKVSPDEEYELNGIRVKTTKSKHYSETVGFVIEGPERVGYTSDGPYFKGQEEYFNGCDYLILNTVIPKGEESEKHLTVDGAVELLKKAEVGVAVLSHFGFTFMRAGFEEQRKYVEEVTGVKTLRARDGVRIDLEEKEGKGLKKYTS